MPDQEELAQVAYEAKVLDEASKILERLDESAEGMLDKEESDMDEEFVEQIGDASDTCGQAAVAMTTVLAEYGHVPDFDTAFSFEDDESDEDDAPAFY